MFFIGTGAYNREFGAIAKAHTDFLHGYTFIIPAFVLPYVIGALVFEIADFPS